MTIPIINNDDETKGEERPLKKTCFPISVEPVLLAVIAIGANTNGVITNLWSRSVCMHMLGLPLANCTGHLEPSVEERIQPYTSNLHLGKVLIETLLPALMTLFIGPWGDANGRKPFIILPLIGYTISSACWGILSRLDISPYFFLLCCLPITLSGGLASLVISTTSYINDICHPEDRPYRLGMAEAAINLGMLSGFLMSPYLFMAGGRYGFETVFFTNTLLSSLSLLYTFCFIPESITHKQKDRKNMFSLNHIKDVYRVITKRRSFSGRTVIFLIVIANSFKTMTIEGEAGVRYLVMRRMFSWNLKEFTTYVVSNLTSIFVGSWVATWLLCRVLHWPEIPIAIATFLLCSASSFSMGFSTTPLMYYITTFFGLLKSVPGPLIVAHVFRILSTHDAGKVYSFMMTLMAITPQLSALLYNVIYSNIEHSYPMAVYELSFLLFASCTALVLTVMILERNKPKSQNVSEVDSIT